MVTHRNGGIFITGEEALSKEGWTLKEKLDDWGTWKRYGIINLGYPAMGIESKISSGMPFTDGNIGGGSKLPEVLYKDNLSAMRIDGAYIKLLSVHPLEMQVLSMYHVFKWSVLRISKKGSVSRHQIRKILIRAETLIEGNI